MTAMSGTKLTFILNQLSRIEHKESSDRIWVLCPYHSDSAPSFTINVDPSKKVPIGWGNCFSCNANFGWNDFAPKLGLQKFSKSASLYEVGYGVRKKLEDDLLGTKESSMNLEEFIRATECSLSEPVSENWRGYDAEFLQKFNCQIAVDKYENQVLIIPVYFEDIVIGGTVARWTKSKNKKTPSYIHLKGGWVKAKGLFPYDYVSTMLDEEYLDYVVIVEGVRDCLRLLKEGIPALCIFGTHTWSDAKIKNVLNLGVSTVVVGMDSGKAGVKAANMILRSLKGKVTRLNIPMKTYQIYAEDKLGWNPDKEMDMHNCPDKIMRKIKRRIEKAHN